MATGNTGPTSTGRGARPLPSPWGRPLDNDLAGGNDERAVKARRC